tara:strand:+ start:34 stop:339 length:306 start_codon:yes stop_codon:yes gene_type:complete
MSQNNLTKEDICIYLSRKKGYSVLYSKKIINNLIEILIDEIKENSFNLKNIGTFKILNKKERIGRNPRTKEIYKIKARKTLAFKPSTNLSRKINIFSGKIN